MRVKSGCPVVKKHPDIPFDTVDRDFVDRYEASCGYARTSLAVTEQDKMCPTGNRYEAQKLADKFHGNQHVSGGAGNQPHQKGRISCVIAKEHGVGKETVKCAEKYAKGVDAIEKDSPGMEHKLLVGEVRITKAAVAIVWICRNQLGRRNLTEQDRTYLLGKQYEAQKMTHGGNTARVHGDDGRFTSRAQNGPSRSDIRIADVIAKEHNVGHNTVKRAEKYVKGVDAIEKDSPGMKHKLLVGEIRITKTAVAIVWICRNQPGRRNLTEQDKTYLIGKQYEAQKKTEGNPGSWKHGTGGKFTVLGQNGPIRSDGTAGIIAKEHHVGTNTVTQAEKYAKGVDVIDQDSPGMKIKLLSGEAKATVTTEAIAWICKNQPCRDGAGQDVSDWQTVRSAKDGK